MGAVAAAEDNSDLMEISDATEVIHDNGISYTFKNLTEDVETSGDSFDVQHDYTFNNETFKKWFGPKEKTDKENEEANPGTWEVDGSSTTGERLHGE